MSFFVMLVAFFAVLHLPPMRRLSLLATTRAKAAVAMGMAFTITGVMHFTTPDRFIAMMPPWLPWHRELVYLSGVFEL